ncbi:MAG: hypoxanthine phosphoribosyltransferase [Synergistaceae bacterium]|nr:hypoxanthine phosphoribosyltransferase [Synergistaceae bacterium]
MGYKIGEILISEKELHDKVAELGDRIRRDYAGKELTCVCVLKGAVVFLADLVRHIGPEVDVRIDFLAISSYGASTKSSGIVQIQKDLSSDINGKHVLIVEDILDTGLSLSYIRTLMKERRPESLAVCVLLDKPERRRQPVDAEYIGFSIPDEFVVGYGLDYAGKFRHLPAVHIAEPE